jgi:hypothetical protein
MPALDKFCYKGPTYRWRQWRCLIEYYYPYFIYLYIFTLLFTFILVFTAVRHNRYKIGEIVDKHIKFWFFIDVYDMLKNASLQFVAHTDYADRLALKVRYST